MHKLNIGHNAYLQYFILLSRLQLWTNVLFIIQGKAW